MGLIIPEIIKYRPEGPLIFQHFLLLRARPHHPQGTYLRFLEAGASGWVGCRGWLHGVGCLHALPGDPAPSSREEAAELGPSLWKLCSRPESAPWQFCTPCVGSAVREGVLRQWWGVLHWGMREGAGRSETSGGRHVGPLQSCRQLNLSSILAWKIPWAEEPDGLQAMGSQGIEHN